jgi:hypothetical protein
VEYQLQAAYLAKLCAPYCLKAPVKVRCPRSSSRKSRTTISLQNSVRCGLPPRRSPYSAHPPKKKAPCTSTNEIDVGERIFQQLVCSDTDRSPTIVRVRPKAGLCSLGVPLDNVLSHCLRLHGEVPERSNGAVSKTVVPLAGDRGFESLPLRNCLNKFNTLRGNGNPSHKKYRKRN